VYLPLVLLVNPDYRKPSDFLLFIHLILVISPMIVLMEMGGKSFEFLFYSVASFLLIKAILIFPNLKMPRVKYGNTVAVNGSIVLIVLTFLMLIGSGGFGKINFDLSQIYELREETATVYFGGIWGYITPWAVKVCIPFLLSLSLLKRMYRYTVIIILIQILMFGITGHRSIAMFSIVAIVIYATRETSNKNLFILALITGFLFSVYLFHIYFDDVIVSSTILRRAFFLPSFLNYSYYEFFSVNEYVYYSNSVLSWLSEYAYSGTQLSHVVAGEVLGKPLMGANTGFLGTSYAHGGASGMLIISIFVAVIMKVIDGLCHNPSDTWFYLSFTTIPMLALFTSAAFFTALLTHGVLIAFILTWLYRYDSPRHLNRSVR